LPPLATTPAGAHVYCQSFRTVFDIWSKISWNIYSKGMKDSRSECYMERKFHKNESSVCGLFAPGNESAPEEIVQVTV